MSQNNNNSRSNPHGNPNKNPHSNPVSEFTETAMSNLRALVDVNTIIGDPITPAEGITILPISKVSFGYGTGGAELPTKVPDKFLGGTGGGVTLQPLGFLVIQNDSVRLLQMETADNTGDRLVNAGAGLVDRILDFIPNKDKKKKGAEQGLGQEITLDDIAPIRDIESEVLGESL